MTRAAVLAVQILVLSILIANSFAGEIPQGLALGIHGIGYEFSSWVPIWRDGNPTLRWRVNSSNAFDLTPSFWYYQDPNGESIYRAGIEIGWVPTMQERGGLILGARVAVGYVYKHWYYDDVESSAELSIGPDIEYFVPTLRNLSIGAQTVVRLRFRWDESSDGLWRTETVSDFWGEFLTMRYYF